MSKDRSYSTAIHTLAILAFREPDLVSSETIAVSLQTNPGLIRRVLLKLSEHGLVLSTKGKGGGNTLAKPPSQISLEDIYVAMKDGPLFGSFDKEPFKECPLSCNMGAILTKVYGELELGLQKNMKKVKLSTIMNEFR